MRELIDQGGWVLGGIVLLSLAAWTLIVGTWLRLRRDTERGLGWADSVVSCVRGRRRDEAMELCRQNPHLIGRFILAGLQQAAPARFFGRKHSEPYLRGELAELQRHLPLIAVMATVAPLLGLLGTILGMVQTFGAITVHGTREAGLIADGISQALLTTQAGLVTALPILVFHHWLSSRARRCTETARLYGKKIEGAWSHG